MKKVKLLFALILMIASYSLIAQVSINTDGSSADASAMLDVKSTDKGMLIPQVALTGVNDASTIATPATSLLIYNTATATGVTPGYYYNSGTSGSPVWERFTTGIIDGSETKVTAGTNVTVTGAGTTASPYVVNTTGATALAIGDSYQGGIIFWLDASGQHGLIAATADQSTGLQWYNGSYTTTGATLDAVYAGMSNTNKIIANQGAGSYATQFCADYSVTVNNEYYDDWYLPSKYELNLLYSQKTAVGAFVSWVYCSSSEYSNNYAWAQLFDNGFQYYYGDKSGTYGVRAVRAF